MAVQATRALSSPMTYLSTQPNQVELARLAWSNVLLAFDYDGTLAPLVSTPSRASMRASTRRSFRHVSRLYPLVVITGRAQRDMLMKLGNIEVSQVIGNHGAEPSLDPDTIRSRVKRWLPMLRERLSDRQGVVIENKEFSVAIHYRHARERASARRAVLAAAHSLPEVRIVGGKLVVNLVLEDVANKGVALERERARLACERVIYVGDDETDEDAFRLRRRPHAIHSCRSQQTVGSDALHS